MTHAQDTNNTPQIKKLDSTDIILFRMEMVRDLEHTRRKNTLYNQHRKGPIKDHSGK